MTPSTRILALLALSTLPLRQLRAEFPDVAPGRLDAILTGLRAAGAIHILGGIASAVSAQASAENDNRRLDVLPGDVALRKRRAAQKWRQENRDRSNELKRQWAQRRKVANAGVTE